MALDRVKPGKARWLRSARRRALPPPIAKSAAFGPPRISGTVGDAVSAPARSGFIGVPSLRFVEVEEYSERFDDRCLQRGEAAATSLLRVWRMSPVHEGHGRSREGSASTTSVCRTPRSEAGRDLRIGQPRIPPSSVS